MFNYLCSSMFCPVLVNVPFCLASVFVENQKLSERLMQYNLYLL